MAAVVGIVASASACSLFDRRPRVAFIGDSITFQTTEMIEGSAIGEQWRVDVEATPGITIGGQLGVAREVAQDPPWQVIVNLGTNDVVLSGAPTQESVQALTEMLDLLSDVPCVHVTTIHEDLPVDQHADAKAKAAALNDEIRRVAAERGVDVIEWDETVVEHSDDPEPVLADQVHPTPHGMELLTQVYFQALQRCEVPPPG